MALGKSFFDFVNDNKNDNIFSIFMNKDSRDANFFMLKKCFEIIKSRSNVQIDKDELIKLLHKFVKENKLCTEKSKNDDNYYSQTNDEIIKNERDFVRVKLKRFIDCGWLIEDQSPKEVFNKYISLNEYTRPIFDAMIETSESDKNPPEYSSNLLNINNSLDSLLKEDVNKNNLYSYYYSIIEHTNKLKSQLSTSSSRIRRYINNVGSNSDLNKIVEDLLYGYNAKIARPFYNFRIKDKPSFLQNIVVNKFDKLLDNQNLISLIADDSLNRKVDMKEEERNRAFNIEKDYILNELKNAYNYLKILDKVIDAIDTKDNNYITATKTKIEYKSLDYHDLRDQINKVIDLINNTEMKEFTLDDKLIDLSNLDEESVRKPSRINEKLDEVIVNVNTLSLEEEKILRNELLKEFKNDFNKIKKKLDEVKDTIFDTSALLKNYDFSIYDIFMIYLHSSDLDFNYEIILKDESLIFNNYKFKNYELRRK